MRSRLKNVTVLSVALLLATLGIYNIFLKATWTLMDDGVFWRQGPQGLAAGRVAQGGPAALAGVRPGDVLLAIDGDEVLRSEEVQARLAQRKPGARVTYSLLRADERRALQVAVKPLSQGNVSLFYYLSLVGFFSLVVGTIVMLRRPPDRAALHFYAICLLFFLMYSTSYTGKLNLADWTLLWTDNLSILFLPVVFLHFCLSFPERRLVTRRAWIIPAAYMPALALAGAAVASQVLFVTTSGSEVLWRITSAIDRWKPIYFAALFALSFGILLDSYRKTRSLTARKQMKWLVWGTGAGVLPFFLFYSIPFALGREPRVGMELAGYIPLALIPLSLAYAVVKHRLMDVELIFRRTLVYTLATAAIVGICLLALNLFQVIVRGDEEPHVTQPCRRQDPTGFTAAHRDHDRLLETEGVDDALAIHQRRIARENRDHIAVAAGQKLALRVLAAPIDPRAVRHRLAGDVVEDPLAQRRAARPVAIAPLDRQVEPRTRHRGRRFATGFIELLARRRGIAQQLERDVELHGRNVGRQQRFVDLALALDEGELEQAVRLVHHRGQTDLARLAIKSQLADPEPRGVELLDHRFLRRRSFLRSRRDRGGEQGENGGGKKFHRRGNSGPVIPDRRR